VTKVLNEKQAGLNKIRAEINRLQFNYKEQQMQLSKLNAQKEESEIMLTRAEKLVNGLADESARWKIAI
jgi:hypothetical protein